MLNCYGWCRECPAEKLQIFLAAEPAVCAGSAARFSFSVLNDFPESDFYSAKSDYVFSADATHRDFCVTTINASFCNSLSFSFSGEIIHTRFLSQSAVVCRWKMLADAAALSKLNFTIVSCAVSHTRCTGNSFLVRSHLQRRVLLNQSVYLDKRILRL